MMKLATWLSVIVLGPGSVAIFVWFLMDVKRLFGGGAMAMPRREDGEAKTQADEVLD
jgi:hypothetical protein